MSLRDLLKAGKTFDELTDPCQRIQTELYTHDGRLNPDLSNADLQGRDGKPLIQPLLGAIDSFDRVKRMTSQQVIRKWASDLYKESIYEVEDRLYDTATTIQRAHDLAYQEGEDLDETRRAVKSYKKLLFAFKDRYSSVTGFDDAERGFLEDQFTVHERESGTDEAATRSPYQTTTTSGVDVSF